MWNQSGIFKKEEQNLTQFAQETHKKAFRDKAFTSRQNLIILGLPEKKDRPILSASEFVYVPNGLNNTSLTGQA